MPPPAYPPLPAPAPLPSPEVQAALDANHLKLLEIGFYISGIVTALRFIWLMFFVVVFSIMGFATTLAPHHTFDSDNNGPPPAFVFFIVAAFFGVFIFLVLIFAGLEIYAGTCLKKRRHPVLIQVVAAVYCISIPWGTALGVFTFMVLNRPSVKPLFS